MMVAETHSLYEGIDCYILHKYSNTCRSVGIQKHYPPGQETLRYPEIKHLDLLSVRKAPAFNYQSMSVQDSSNIAAKHHAAWMARLLVILQRRPTVDSAVSFGCDLNVSNAYGSAVKVLCNEL